VTSISISTTMTNPEERMDPWKEAIRCYKDLADEVVILGEDWPNDFSWDYIGKKFHEGFIKAKGDWVIRMDLDYFFHEKDIEYIKNLLHKSKDYPAVAFPRHQYFTLDRFQVISYVCIAVNKKSFPDIKLNGGGDLCLPTLNGELINPKEMPLSKVPIWNYEMMFKTKKVIYDDRVRYAKAWYDYFNEWGVFGGGTKEQAYDAWFKLIKERYPKHINRSGLQDHPKYITSSLETLRPEQFGFDCFGLKDKVKFDKKEYIKKYINVFNKYTK
jgi:hypothetical protein